MIEKLLIIDDDDQDIFLIKKAIQEISFEGTIKSINSGEEACEAVQKFQPDIVITDTMLPGIDGFEVCRAVKKINEQIVVFIITGRIETLDGKRAFDSGANDYIAKAAGFESLKAALSKYIS